MPTCQKCFERFPTRVQIDGRDRHLGNRKFCLVCSPFGQRNNRDITQPVRVYSCAHCGNTRQRTNKFCAACIAEGRGGQRKVWTLDEARTDASRRRHLFRTRPHRCEMPGCGQTTWLGQPIPLEMDHIDGNSDNNTEENLRLICPNCHALTPTAKGKNRGRGRTRQRNKNQRYAEGKTY